jgi:hypothetical protein
MAIKIPKRGVPVVPKKAPPAPLVPDGSFSHVAPGAEVWIYEFVKEFVIIYWLCRRHLAERAARDDRPRTRRVPPHDGLRCYDCHFEELAAAA